MKDMGDVKGDLVAAREQLHEEKVHVLALPRIRDSWNDSTTGIANYKILARIVPALEHIRIMIQIIIDGSGFSGKVLNDHEFSRRVQTNLLFGFDSRIQNFG